MWPLQARREGGFREELACELDFKGELGIEQVENMGSAYCRWQEKHKGR